MVSVKAAVRSPPRRPDAIGLAQFEVVARHHVSASEIGAQPLAGLELMRLDQGAAVASAPARQPSERAFGFIDGDIDAAEFGRDLPFGQVEMLAAKAVDRRAVRPRGRRIFP
jgi:hypothetical protein